jgi:hypothetical protein
MDGIFGSWTEVGPPPSTTGRRRTGPTVRVGCALLGASNRPTPEVHHRHPEGPVGSNVPPRPEGLSLGDASVPNGVIPDQPRRSPRLGAVLVGIACCPEGMERTLQGFGPASRASSRPREGTPVSSGAGATDLVRRESAWQRAGPPGRSEPTEEHASRSWFARKEVDVGPPRRTALPAERRRPRETDRLGRPSGRTGREPRRRVSLPDPKPHERDRMKHAGRSRRGGNRQGREKRRRRSEASLEARDEEPGPFGTCTTVLLFGREPRAVSTGLRSLSFRASARNGELRSWRTTDGRPSLVRPRNGIGRQQGRDVPSGERPGPAAGRPRDEPDAVGYRWPPSCERATLGTSVPVRTRLHGEPTMPRLSGWPHAGRPTRRNPMAVHPWTVASRTAEPPITTTDSSAVGQWAAT